MGGILTPSKESEIIKLIRQDNDKKLQDFLVKNNLNPDSLYTKRKRTLIQLCCYFSSPKCVSALIKMNYDYNKKEISNDYSPLYIACKFNCLDIVKILLSQKDINLMQSNDDHYNEFEIAFLRGNYNICYYLLFEYKYKGKNSGKNKKQENLNNIYNENEKEINTKKEEEEEKNNENEIDIDLNQPYQKFFFSNSFNIEKYLSLQKTNEFPLFNMELFYESLNNQILPENCSSFAAEHKRTKDLLTKVPDPNETWGHFFKRLSNMELYNPPLVDKRNISHMNSLYMNTQMKLIENEYGIKMNYYESNEETKNEFDDEQVEEDKPIIRIQNTEKKFLKEDVDKDNGYENDNDNDNKKDNISDNNTSNNILNVNINKGRKRKINEGINVNKDNVCVISINNTNKSSDRPIKSSEQIEDDEKQ